MLSNLISLHSSGYYISGAQGCDTLGATEEAISGLMTKELMEGCEGAEDIKCGIIGEIGCSWPLHGESYVSQLFHGSKLYEERKCGFSVTF